MNQIQPDAKAEATSAVVQQRFGVAEWVREYRARLFQIYVVVVVIAFAVLLVLAHATPYFAFDLIVAKFIQSFRFTPLVDAMVYISGLGFAPLSYILSTLIILYLFVSGLRWEAGMATFAALGVTLMGALFKLFVQRARPTPDLVNVFSPLNDYSFPSGHVLVFTAFLGFLWFLVYTHAPHSYRRTLALVVFGILILLVGVSRIYLGQHWPSDVIGAYLFGSAWLWLTITLYRRYQARFSPQAKAEARASALNPPPPPAQINMRGPVQ
jgi:undecaprenyl-diphosphatase